MYLFMSDEKNIPVSYMGASAFLHGCVFMIAGILALKLTDVKTPIIPKTIEVEYIKNNNHDKIKLEHLPIAKIGSLSNTQTDLFSDDNKVKHLNPTKINNDAKKNPNFKKNFKASQSVKSNKLKQTVEDSKWNDFSNLNLKGQLWDDSDNQHGPDVDLNNLEKNSKSDFENINPKLKTSDIEKDLEQEDQKNSQNYRSKEQKVIATLNSEANKVGNETERRLNELKAQSRKKAGDQLAELRKASKVRDAAILSAAAVAAAAEKAGSVKSGSEKTGTAFSSSPSSKGHSSTGKSGFGNNSMGSIDGYVDGIPEGAHIRSLGELRQRPGNRKPEYQMDDRRFKRQGGVVYYAYINTSGVPSKFVKIKSTGYESLDKNTLSVLKTWRFFPGQQGWVELPFEWSLKGGAVEAPALLRR